MSEALNAKSNTVSDSIEDQAQAPRSFPNKITHARVKKAAEVPPSQAAKHIGEPRPEILAKEVEIGLGQRRNDMNWKSVKGTFGDLLNGLLSKHAIGDKDGTCIIQGVLSGPQRTFKNVKKNYLVMVDVDTGETLDDVQQTLVNSGLFGVIWTTHSHLKDTSEVVEDAFLQWSRNQLTEAAGEIKSIARYMREVKKYTEPLCETIESVTKEFVEGGLKYIAKHAPMSRLRILFVLAEPFDFANRGTHTEAINEWKTNYKIFSDKLGVAWDTQCVDPSRLMYLPRRSASTAPELHEIRVVWGDMLTIERMKESGGTASDPLSNFVGPDAGKKTFVTPNLMKFIGQYRYDFQAADWLESVDAAGMRGHRSSGPGIHFECPNEENHSEITPNDIAFMAINASDGTEGFTLHCMHTTCRTMSDGDRVWFLDKACQKYGIEDAMNLRAFCPGAPAEEAAVEARGAAIITAGDIDERIETITPDTDVTIITDIISALAQEKPSLQIHAKIEKIIAKRENRGRGAIKDEYRRLRSSFEAANAPPPVVLAREPSDVETYRGPVLTHWHETTQIDVARNIFVEGNLKKPTIFKRREGGVVRAVQTYDGVILENVFSLTDWSSVIYDHVKFQQADPQARDLVYIVPPAKLVDHFKGRRDLDLPIVERISRIPHLGPDGTLRWEKGYDPATRTYLDPVIDFLPVPEVIEDAHVEDATWWLTEAVRDFPFSDGFNGSDLTPVKTNVLDEDGFYEPNWDRGRSSRLNAIAMIMQPFVRDCIDGPCPAFHIDKSSPGTGAGYLTDVAYIIAEGERAIAQTMSENPEEFRKAITATLRGGASIIFIDNINQKVASGHLAAALTAGVWKDRVLGISETCVIPIRSTWIMAGNNLSFTPELMRRNIPIRLDASTVNPAKDRVGAKDFKHFPLQKFLKERRPELVWSIHVLLMNWVQKTNMAWGSKRLNSFDSWAGVMSGIFEAADMKGFIENIPDYLNEMDEDSSADHELGKLLIEKFGEDPCKVSDIQGVLENPMSDVTMDSLGLKGHTPGARAVSLGHYLSKMCKGRTYQPDPDDPTRKYKLSKKTVHGYSVYQFNKLKLA
jgi:hypothetical protein